jgi:Outer membrane lipoprotein-sorting protein
MKILSAVAAIIFFAVGALAETTNDLSDAEIQGQQLAQQLCNTRPSENLTNAGVLKIRDNKGQSSEISLKLNTYLTEGNWRNSYEAIDNSNRTVLEIIHRNNTPNIYVFGEGKIANFWNLKAKAPNGTETMFPFAGDFWVADLGLEFFHWPEQKILKKENRRSRGCNVLESMNPNPSANAYSRVVSWIDEGSGGIVHAEAYDAQNKLLKEFDPKSFKKVNGQWELQEMEIRNVQTGSRSRIEFDLKK